MWERETKIKEKYPHLFSNASMELKFQKEYVSSENKLL